MSKLRAARLERSWTQVQLARRLAAAAAREGQAIPRPELLNSTISRWENGKAEPDTTYRRWLEQAFGEDIFGAARSAAQPEFVLDVVLEQSQFGTAQATDHLHRQVQLVRELDGSLDAPAALNQARTLLDDANNRLMFSLRPEDRRRVAVVVADLASLVGWQSLDAGDVRSAWVSFEQAKAAAREAGDSALLAHAMGEQSFALIDAGRCGDAVALIQAAAREPLLPGRLMAWLAAAEAEALSGLGETSRARQCMRMAEQGLPGAGDEHLTPYLRLDEANLARWRGHTLARLFDPAAGPELRASLASVQGRFGRAEAGVLVDLATVAFRDGDQETGRLHITEAKRVSMRTGSVRQQRRIAALQQAA